MKRIAAHIRPYTSYNPFFIIPFVIWIIIGGAVQLFFDNRQLFAFFNVHHSSFGDAVMTYATLMGEGVFSTVVLLILLGVRQYRNVWYFLSALLTNVLPVAVIQSIKYAVDAPRPLKYFNEARWIHILPQWPRLMEHSFPSGHTSAAFCLFTFLAMLLPGRYRGWGMVLFLCALSVAYSRMYLAAHFFLDIYVGSIIGATFTIGIMAIMNRVRSHFFTDTIADVTDN